MIEQALITYIKFNGMQTSIQIWSHFLDGDEEIVYDPDDEIFVRSSKKDFFILADKKKNQQADLRIQLYDIVEIEIRAFEIFPFKFNFKILRVLE